MKKTISILIVMLALAAYPAAPAANVTAQNLSNKIFLPAVQFQMAGLFVSPQGRDSNPGTFDQPLRTISSAVNLLKAGDTLYVRGGTYREAVTVRASGTEQKPIKILAYAGETPVIDGGNQLPSTWRGLIYLAGDWIQVSGFEVKNSRYMGVLLQGRHNRVDHIFAHHSQGDGIYVQGDYGTVENCRIWRNALSNENNKAGKYDPALTTGRDRSDGTTDYAVLRNNTVWENWGIGIDTYESNGTIIEGNVVHDNLISNIYISDATNITCNRNFFYMTPGSITYGKGVNVGLLLGDEKYTPASKNITITNNIAYGNDWNLKWFAGVQGGGMNNVLIANNSFIDAMPLEDNSANIDISTGPHQNVRVMNNIILQSGSRPSGYIVNNGGITQSRNIWSKKPNLSLTGTSDIVADPRLHKTGTPYSIAWYQLLNSSPAISFAVPLAEVPFDYLNRAKGAKPDAGALEYHE